MANQYDIIQFHQRPFAVNIKILFPYALIKVKDNIVESVTGKSEHIVQNVIAAQAFRASTLKVEVYLRVE
jgi:hypothetical protein